MLALATGAQNVDVAPFLNVNFFLTFQTIYDRNGWNFESDHNFVSRMTSIDDRDVSVSNLLASYHSHIADMCYLACHYVVVESWSSDYS